MHVLLTLLCLPMLSGSPSSLSLSLRLSYSLTLEFVLFIFSLCCCPVYSGLIAVSRSLGWCIRLVLGEILKPVPVTAVSTCSTAIKYELIKKRRRGREGGRESDSKRERENSLWWKFPHVTNFICEGFVLFGSVVYNEGTESRSDLNALILSDHNFAFVDRFSLAKQHADKKNEKNQLLFANTHRSFGSNLVSLCQKSKVRRARNASLSLYTEILVSARVPRSVLYTHCSDLLLTHLPRTKLRSSQSLPFCSLHPAHQRTQYLTVQHCTVSPLRSLRQ